MKKKGFTLVELLAVIAVLAILILLVIPNVMKLFNDAKQKSFETELKEIYKTAQQKWMMESLNKKEERVYARVKSLDCVNQLSLTGRTELDYVIKLDKKGKVVLYFASDDTYEYTYRGPGLAIESIDGVIQISKKDTNRQIQMTCTTAQLVTPPPENEGDYLVTVTATSYASYFLKTSIIRNDIEKITFTNSLEGHSPNGTNCWDVSKGSTGAVLAWATDTDNNGLYEITVGSKGAQVFAYEGKKLFADMEHLKSIDGIENFNTSQVTDMSEMFYNCRELDNLDLSELDTSKVTNMSSMFAFNFKLTNLNLDNFNTSKVTNMNKMFYGCLVLPNLNVSSFDTSKVTNMEDMFGSCKSLTSLDVSNFNTSNVTNMAGMFNCLKSISTIDLSNFDTSKVTNMGGMFAYSSFVTLDLSKFNTQNLTTVSETISEVNPSGSTSGKVGGMFTGCRNLKTINLSNFNTSKVTNMSYMFMDCESLTSLDISSFNTSRVTNMYYLFGGCNKLQAIYVSNSFTASNVNSFSMMFHACYVLYGGEGTKCPSNQGSDTYYSTYARVDGGPSNPGCLTLK